MKINKKCYEAQKEKRVLIQRELDIEFENEMALLEEEALHEEDYSMEYGWNK